MAALTARGSRWPGWWPGSTAAPLIEERLSGPADTAETIGIELAEILLGRGADEILKNLTSAARVT